MKKALLVILSLALALGLCFGITASAENVEEISTADQLVAIGNGSTGNYKLTADIDLGDKYVNNFLGTLDGNGKTITVNNTVGVFASLGSVEHPATVKNFTVKGTVKGTGAVGGVAASAIATIENVTVEADISSTNYQYVAGVANCKGKNPLTIKNCTFAGTLTLSQGFKSASNYTYFGMFLGYNGGALGGGQVVDSVAKYTFTLPTEQANKISKIEFFNDNAINEKQSTYTTTEQGENTVYSFDCVINMQPVTLESVNDEGIMANYGSPVIRFTMKDKKTYSGHTVDVYRYIDGYDKAKACFSTKFSVDSLDEMHEYHDISYLTIESLGSETLEGTDKESGASQTVTSDYSMVTVNTADEFLSFYRLVNSAIPSAFSDKNGNLQKPLSILNMLATSVKLGNNISLKNNDEFYGFGKQEFFPYRGGIDGNNHTLHVEIEAENGYCVGVLGIASEMARDIEVKNLTVTGYIRGKTKVGIIGYFDMVCNSYIAGGNANFNNVTNKAEVSGYTAVGGLLGAVSASNDIVKVFIRDSKNEGEIKLSAKGSYAGGLVGVAGFYQSTGLYIDNSSNSGNVTGESETSYLGGIVGRITDGQSTINAENSGTVTGGSIYASIAGASGAAKMKKFNKGDIHTYSVTTKAELEKWTFAKEEYTSSFGTQTDIALAKQPTANFAVNVTVQKEDGSYLTFNGSNELTVGTTFLVYSVNPEPGTYTVRMIVREKEGYYNNGSIEDKLEPEATCKLIVEKPELNFTFGDVKTAYTGKAINYLDVASSLKDDRGNKLYNTEIPKYLGDATPQASWEVEYYSGNQKLSGAPTAAGEYKVKVRLNATELFKSRYVYDFDKVYEHTMTIARTLVITADNLQIESGSPAEFTATAISSDGGKVDISSLSLKFRLASASGSLLPEAMTADMLDVGTYKIVVQGPAEFNGYEIQYRDGTLTVVQPQDDGGKTDKKGCGNCKGGISGAGFISLLALALYMKKR